MLRNLNATYAGKRILASPYVGVLASVIAAETAEGDHGPGILYNESVDPTYAGKYLRAWVTNPPAVGKLSVAENGAIEAVDLPNGVHTFSYDLIVNDIYDSASSLSITVGAVDAVATGGAGAGIGSGTGGDAVGQVAGVASGGTGTGIGSGSGGEATGEVGGSASATGGTGTGVGSGSGGDASGVVSAVVSGGTGTGVGSGSGGDAVGGSADAVASGGAGGGAGAGTGGAAVGNADITQFSHSIWRISSYRRVFRVASHRRVYKVTEMTRQLPTKDVEETKKITFDFSHDADSVSSPDISIEAVDGNLLADVIAMKVGSATAGGTTVTQLIGGGEAGTTYRIRCRANDADGEVHVLSANMKVALT